MIHFDVILTVCSIITGNCFDHHITKWANRMPTPFECVKYGQLEAVKFMETHPNYKLKAWGCRKHGEAA